MHKNVFELEMREIFGETCDPQALKRKLETELGDRLSNEEVVRYYQGLRASEEGLEALNTMVQSIHGESMHPTDPLIDGVLAVRDRVVGYRQSGTRRPVEDDAFSGERER